MKNTTCFAIIYCNDYKILSNLAVKHNTSICEIIKLILDNYRDNPLTLLKQKDKK